jgi:hypothetical protein
MMTAPRDNGTAEEAAAVPPPHHVQASAEPAPPERIMVALIPKAGQELQQLHGRTGLSMTDIVNRAIALYGFIETQLAAGRRLLIRDESTGETLAVEFR